MYSGNSWKQWRGYPRFCYATDFTGVVDLLAFLPYVVAHFFVAGSDANVFFAMLQLVCVVKLDRVLPAFTLLDDVVASGETARLLATSAMLSSMLWVLFA